MQMMHEMKNMWKKCGFIQKNEYNGFFEKFLMEHEMSFKRLLFMLVLGFVLVSCSRNTSTGEFVHTTEKDGVTYVKNSHLSEICDSKYTLTEEMTIGNDTDENYMLTRPFLLRLDRQENIYLLDIKLRHVKVFSKEGLYIRTIGSKGAGPGELLAPRDMIVDGNMKLHILDFKNNKIARFLPDGTAEKDLKLSGSSPKKFYYSSTGFYYYVVFNYPSERGHESGIITKYNYNGDVVEKSRPFVTWIEHSEKQGKFILTIPKPFDPKGYFAFGNGDLIYYGFSNKFVLEVYNPVFKKVREISVADFERVKISNERKKRYLDYVKSKFRKKGIEPDLGHVKVPHYDQVFDNLWIDNQGRLLVRTQFSDEKTQIYIFDNQGAFLEVMEFLPPADGIKLKWVFNRPVFLNNRIYAIVQNDEGLFFIKRYKINAIPRRNHD